MECKFCIDDLNFTAKVTEITTKCKYHKKIGQVYTASKVAPLGLCRELFYAVYPWSLAVLYNGRPVRGWLRKKGIQKFMVGCPAVKGIKVEVRSEEIFFPLLRMFKELIEELCKIIIRPLDGVCRRVVIEIKEVGSDCPKGYRVGDKFYFNIDKQDELCPASFSAMYPFLRLMKDSKKELGVLDPIRVHCPDWVGVTYEINID